MNKSFATSIVEEFQKESLLRNGIDPEKIKQVYANHKDFSKMKSLYEDSFSKTSDDPTRTFRYFQEQGQKYLYNDISDYQDPHEYIILRQVEEGIRLSIKEFGYPLIDTPKIGTLFTPNVNATVYSMTNVPDKIILVRTGILEYFTDFIKTILTLIDWEVEDNQISATPNQETAIKKVYQNGDLLYSIFYSMGKVIMNELDINNNLENKHYKNYMYYHLSSIRASIWRFIMGHEYAHILNGDFNDNPLMFDGTIKNIKNSTLPLNHLREFNADARGFELMNKFMIEHGRSQFTFSIISICMFFAGIDLIYRMVGDVLETDYYKNASLTHPTPFERYTALVNNIYRNSPDKEHTMEALEVASKFGQIVEVIYHFRGGFTEELRKHKNYIKSAWM